jgi:hypothetical protein
VKNIYPALFALSLILGALPANAEFSMNSETILVTQEDTTSSSALYQAKRQALERVLESYLQSKTDRPIHSTQALLNHLWPKADKFFEGQQIQEQKSNLLNAASIKIQFKIKTKELTQAADALIDAWQKQKTKFRIALYVNETSNNQSPLFSSLGMALENSLLKQGYTILDQDYTQRLINKNKTDFGSILNNKKQISDLLKYLDADIIIVLNNDLKQAKIDNKLQLTSHVTLRQTDATSGTKGLNIEEFFVETGTSLDPVNMALGKKSAEILGAELGNNLLNYVIQNINPIQTADSEKNLFLVISGINTYRKQVMPLMKVMREITEIKSIETLTQNKDEVRYLLKYTGTQVELENKLFQKIEGQEVLNRLDRSAAVENTVLLAFSPPIHIYLSGVSDYRKQALPFIQFIKSVAHVKEVEIQKFAGAELALKVYYDGLNSDLEKGIWDKLASERDYPSLFREPSQEGEIRFNVYNQTMQKAH